MIGQLIARHGASFSVLDILFVTVCDPRAAPGITSASGLAPGETGGGLPAFPLGTAAAFR